MSRSSVDALGPGRHVVLFVDPTQPEGRQIEDRFCAIAWPPGTRPVVVDLSAEPESARWYGITRGPAVAVVCDGVLLDVEHECSEQACARVRESAARRDPRAFEGLLHTSSAAGSTTSTHSDPQATARGAPADPGSAVMEGGR